ncbi:protein serine/threonine phosphatase PrpC [Geminocystis sp. NIES-3708]|uniref:PP2C family protein-serine/threonine phosphatase n=1 Tax=Geminocystis sp. NIES-3708 TaxID=1615909 RepID=UPI0005FC951C|nr:protein phosphatase 2C domain-containing protein [Geminocystis sp. NIES-3708]BAQ60131.1 protein serine/threonine phosphatase PrpC [Geminocystis sp. NIES-3708]
MELLTIEEQSIIFLENIELEIINYLGKLNPNIYYFQVKIIKGKESSLDNQLGLLRIGDINSNLSLEIELRSQLPNYGMISELWASINHDNVIVNLSNSNNNKVNEDDKMANQDDEIVQLSELEIDKDKPIIHSPNLEITDLYIENQQETNILIKDIEDKKDNYLEEEYYPEIEANNQESSAKLLVLTPYPDEENNLAQWLTKPHTDEEYLYIIVQLCQCFFYLSQNSWYCLDLFVEFIIVGTPIKFYDLTHIYPKNIELKIGFLGKYSAPELAYSKEINQFMSSYVIGALMYQMFHDNKLPNPDNLTINLIPKIYQILQVCLYSITEERYPLNQLLKLLIEIKNDLKKITISWEKANKSILGLSLKRLVNEDSYGIKQLEINQNNIILAGIADGMGGMAQGELASKLAIQTLLETPFNFDLNNQENQTNWLTEIFNQANQNINKKVEDGGTTLSVILAVNNQLIISHVGDSRIYLIRNKDIIQLSEDHSLVNMMLTSGQITYEESLDHPDRNVLIKFLGSKSVLSDGYVQNLSKNFDKISLTLEDNDLLILCSDGVWDLISNEEFIELFTEGNNLHFSIDKVIEKVLHKGASDNATIITLKCSIHPYKF